MIQTPTTRDGQGLPDIADHFMACARLGRYLTTFDESRFIITDDFAPTRHPGRVAAAAGAVFSRDPLVAQAAIVPLGRAALAMPNRDKARFEELFSLIEEQALAGEVRLAARSILESGFREARIRVIAAELGGKISPARIRYRSFLDVVMGVIGGHVSADAFRDEFLAFTHDVAGKLDFGIYSFCLDRIFINPKIDLKAKGYLVAEIIHYPPLIRREMITNLLTAPGQAPALVEFTRQIIKRELDDMVATEIYLLEALKSSKLSAGEIEGMLVNKI